VARISLGGVNLDLLRSFFAIVAQGSLNKAAERQHVSQSTLTRQMQALEREIGGALLERGPSGVALTATGHALAERMEPALAEFDRALAEVRRRARGQSAELRVGYLMSAVTDYLHPALAELRRAHPEVKVTLRDLSPGEQIAALRRGELDLALIGSAGRLLDKEFYVRKLAVLPIFVALPAPHALAGRASLGVADLRGELFVGAPEADVPGHNRWVTRLARRAGFRARFVQDADSLVHGLTLVVTDGAVSLLPEYATKVRAPGVAFVPLRDAEASWDLMVAWQRGKVSAPARALLDALG
jgi:DNA-binding transcriptional LysR family regulator